MIGKMRKKGLESFWSNLIGVVLAVAGLTIIFVFVAPKLYDIVVNEDAQKAKSTLEVLEGRINAFISSDLEEATINLQGFNRKEKIWKIVGYDSQDANRPDKCFFSSCVCICPVKVVSSIRSVYSFEGCQEAGFCRDLDIEKINVDTNYVEEFSGAGYTDKTDITYKEATLWGIDLPKNFLQLKLKKSTIDEKIVLDILYENPNDRDKLIK